MRASGVQKSHRVLVLNAKGGCGKTTVATNLACQFACEGHSTALIDYDPQCSSTHWLENRPAHLPTIHSISVHYKRPGVTSAWHLKTPPGTTRVVVDTPARLESMTAVRLIRESDTVLIPVIASAIDIRAARHFIEGLLRTPELRHTHKRLAILGNRNHKNSKVYKDFHDFLTNHNIPFLTSLSDSRHYVQAAEEGLGIQELGVPDTQSDCQHWHALVRWIEQGQLPPHGK